MRTSRREVMITRMISRDTLVRFTRRTMVREPPPPQDEGVRDVLRRVQDAEREVARTIESLDVLAQLLRDAVRPPDEGASAVVPPPPAATPRPGLRRSVPPA